MPVTITIDDVPESVRDELESIAAARGQSLRDFLREELGRITLRHAHEPKLSTDEWLAQARALSATMRSDVTADDILWARDADRR